MCYVLGFVCVLALSLIGCSETDGSGGDVVSHCTGEGDNGTRCSIGDIDGECAGGICYSFECAGLPDGTGCLESGLMAGALGVCVGEECEILPGDCTGLEDSTECVVGDARGVCLDEACATADCEGLEDLTGCYYTSMHFTAPGACVDGECSHALGDCTDVLDGVPCVYGDPAPSMLEPGVCEGGVCEPQN